MLLCGSQLFDYKFSRYNTFGTPLSPILEERESASNSDSVNVTRDDSQDMSTASKGGSSSLSEDDVLLIDTQTNRATIVEGVQSYSQESQVIMAASVQFDSKKETIKKQ